MNDKKNKTIKEQLLIPVNNISERIQCFEKETDLSVSQKERLKEVNASINQILDLIIQLPESDIKNSDFNKEGINNNLILVVEDNLTNQELLLQQLDVLGYSADTANNGREALDKLKQKNYTLILTDLNMPLIDGYQLTKIIREMELKTSRHIIIAITANALIGEEEKCLHSGMDAYLSKPLNIHDLKKLLEKWMTGLSGLQINLSEHGADNNRQIIDKSCLIRSMGDDNSKHLIVLKSYLKNAPEVITNLIDAYNNRDIQQIGFYSHKIKSSSYSIGATELADANMTVEQAAKENDWTIIDNIAPNIEVLFAEVESAIKQEFFDNKEI